ncbi:MAG: LysE family translocator [Syntrophorhabdaceae bacterium]
MIGYIAAAVILGLSAGFSPGPLLALVIAQTLRYGIKEGIKVSLAPLITDVPIIAIAIFLVSRFSSMHSVLGSISLAGGLFVIYLAWETFTARQPLVAVSGRQVHSLGKGIAVNALSPHPYLFWITVGAPTVVRAYDHNPATSIAFIISFAACLVGAKILVAFVVGKSKTILTGTIYRMTMRFLGVALFIFALFLIHDGMVLFGVMTKFP